MRPFSQDEIDEIMRVNNISSFSKRKDRLVYEAMMDIVKKEQAAKERRQVKPVPQPKPKPQRALRIYEVRSNNRKGIKPTRTPKEESDDFEILF